MDLVDEEHIAFFEVGKDRREIARALDSRPAGDLDIRPHLVRNHARKGSFTQARRSREQNVIDRIAALACSLDKNEQAIFDLLLADVVVELAWTKRALER